MPCVPCLHSALLFLFPFDTSFLGQILSVACHQAWFLLRLRRALQGLGSGAVLVGPILLLVTSFALDLVHGASLHPPIARHFMPSADYIASTVAPPAPATPQPSITNHETNPHRSTAGPLLLKFAAGDCSPPSRRAEYGPATSSVSAVQWPLSQPLLVISMKSGYKHSRVRE